MKSFRSLTAVALAAIPLAIAQTFSDCDPTKKTDCPAKPGLNSAEYFIDFTTTQAPTSEWTVTSNSIDYSAEGAKFSIKAAGEGPTIGTNFYIFGGYVEVVMKAAPGAGICSSFVMQSDTLDEIDWEMIGSDAAQVQSNYFGKGNTTTYDRGQFHPVAEPATNFATYAVDWTMEKTTWYINGVAVRTLNYAEAVGGANYPQSPMNIRLGNWIAGSPGNSPGTIEWAGGLADLNQAPFDMIVKSVRIKNYAPAASYKYGDQSGSFQSIEALQDGTAAPVEPPSSGAVDETANSGPGEVPYASGSALPASGVVSISTGSPAAAATGNCTTATSVAAESATISIGTGAMTAPSGYSWTNLTSGGIVNAGPAPSNVTKPIVSISTGDGSASTLLTATTPAAESAAATQTFGLGGSQPGASSTRTPAQVTANPGAKVHANGLVAIAAVAFGYFAL